MFDTSFGEDLTLQMVLIETIIIYIIGIGDGVADHGDEGSQSPWEFYNMPHAQMLLVLVSVR